MQNCRGSLSEGIFKRVISKSLECSKKNPTTGDLKRFSSVTLPKSLSLMGNFLDIFQKFNKKKQFSVRWHKDKWRHMPTDRGTVVSGEVQYDDMAFKKHIFSEKSIFLLRSISIRPFSFKIAKNVVS